LIVIVSLNPGYTERGYYEEEKREERKKKGEG